MYYMRGCWRLTVGLHPGVTLLKGPGHQHHQVLVPDKCQRLWDVLYQNILEKTMEPWSSVFSETFWKCNGGNICRRMGINEVNWFRRGVVQTGTKRTLEDESISLVGLEKCQKDIIRYKFLNHLKSCNESFPTSVWVVLTTSFGNWGLPFPHRWVALLQRWAFGSCLAFGQSVTCLCFAKISLHCQWAETKSKIRRSKAPNPVASNFSSRSNLSIGDTTWPWQKHLSFVVVFVSHGTLHSFWKLRDLRIFPLKTSDTILLRDVSLDSFCPTKLGTCRVPFFFLNQGLGEWKLRPRRCWGVSFLKEVCILERNGMIQFFRIIFLLEILLPFLWRYNCCVWKHRSYILSLG